MRVCFHLHSKYSKDSFLSLEKIAEIAKKNKIDVVILSDHNNLVSKDEIEKIKEIKIIAGEEIKTKEGEIIGIFLKEKIEKELSLKETIKKIKEQNGLVIVPHPFDLFRTKRIKKKALFENIDEIEIVEIFNSRTIFNFFNKKAEEFAKKHQKIIIIGSDAHSQFEIDRAIIEMEDFKDQFDFLKKLKEAKFYPKKTSLFIQPIVIINKILRFFI
ncbi:MAG: PHP domain-containing protein [Patescibacteria group bacterium]